MPISEKDKVLAGLPGHDFILTYLDPTEHCISRCYARGIPLEELQRSNPKPFMAVVGRTIKTAYNVKSQEEKFKDTVRGIYRGPSIVRMNDLLIGRVVCSMKLFHYIHGVGGSRIKQLKSMIDGDIYYDEKQTVIRVETRILEDVKFMVKLLMASIDVLRKNPREGILYYESIDIEGKDKNEIIRIYENLNKKIPIVFREKKLHAVSVDQNLIRQTLSYF